MTTNLNHTMQVKGIEIDAEPNYDLPVDINDMIIKRTNKGINIQRALAEQPTGEAYFDNIKGTPQCRETYHNQLAAYNAKFSNTKPTYNFSAAVVFVSFLCLVFWLGLILVLKYVNI